MTPSNLSELNIEKKITTSQAGRKSKKNNRLVALALTATIALALILLKPYYSTPKVSLSKVTMVFPSQKYTLLNAAGYVVPQRKASLSSKAQGRLEWLGVLEGSKVKKGEIIARLEKNDVEAAYQKSLAQNEVAKANLNKGLAELREAKLNVRRSKELFEKKYISQAQHDSNLSHLEKSSASIEALKATIKSGEASIRVAKIAVEQTVITAPFDGVILTKSANVGDNITPFSSAADSKGAVVTIADMNTLEVEADVSESRIYQIEIEQPCQISLDAIPDIRLTGFVSRMVPTVDRSKATVLVKIQFTEYDPRVLPDMSAKVAFLTQKVPEKEKNAVPAIFPSAIVNKDSKNIVYLFKEGYIYEIPVQLGKKIGGKIEISGLEVGDEIVVNPTNNLQNGLRVERQ